MQRKLTRELKATEQERPNNG